MYCTNALLKFCRLEPFYHAISNDIYVILPTNPCHILVIDTPNVVIVLILICHSASQQQFADHQYVSFICCLFSDFVWPYSRSLIKETVYLRS